MRWILTYTVLLTTLAAWTAPAGLAQSTKTWVGDTTGDWDDGNNWSPVGEPEADDDVVIEGEIMTPGITVYVTEDDDVCRTVDLFYAKIIINGGILTTGEDGVETTSFLDDKSEIRFQDNGGTAQATLFIRNWVEFIGDGRIIADPDENGTHRPFIQRADSLEDSGIKVVGDLRVIGHMTLEVGIHHDCFEFGVFDPDATMIIGTTSDQYDPALEISGDALNAATFKASLGTIEFVQMTFASTAPKWTIRGDFIDGSGTIVATAQFTNVPNDIDLERYSLLEITGDQTFNGKLHMQNKDTKILVKDGAVATFEAP